MIFENIHDSPFQIKVSFHRVIEILEKIAEADIDYRSAYAKGLLQDIYAVPEISTGIPDYAFAEKHRQLLKNLLSDLFPTALTKNEIKAVTIPFQNIIFNFTERFREILNDAGPEFDIFIRNYDAHSFYVLSCCIILNGYYKYNADFSKPLFYDIPDKNGILKHYRILYNADFLEVIPTEKAVDLTPEDFNLLIDNYDNTALWKEKFPPQSWILKGFGIMSLFDNTVESAVSMLKTNLLTGKDDKQENESEIVEIFRSIFKMPELRIGFTAFSENSDGFAQSPFNIASHLMNVDQENRDGLMCGMSFETIVRKKKYLIISDVEKFSSDHPEQAGFARHLSSQDIKSCIFSPVLKNGRLLGVVELVSGHKHQLNSVNANKLELVLPFLIDTIDRHYSDTQNRIDAIIQKEYTSIHPSVYWKFRDEAVEHLKPEARDNPFREIIISDVTPLYGQIDVRSSSTVRNTAVSEDLSYQLSWLHDLFITIAEKFHSHPVDEQIEEIAKLQTGLQDIRADTEAVIHRFILDDIHPMLGHFRIGISEVTAMIDSYFEQLDTKFMMVYRARRNFDETLSVINKKMAAVLDDRQEAAQLLFPHYYERFKTDGVEHNLYIGAAIAEDLKYEPSYLRNLRLWQLQAMAAMENEYMRLKPRLQYDLDVASLILVFSTPISIRFRMDEKRFDVDGTYNARYEMVKKRIDKSMIKGTDERITEKGKLTIVYTQEHEEAEYREYLKLLQLKKIFGNVIEQFDVEDLQGVTGLKALRVGIEYSKENRNIGHHSYDDLKALQS